MIINHESSISVKYTERSKNYDRAYHKTYEFPIVIEQCIETVEESDDGEYKLREDHMFKVTVDGVSELLISFGSWGPIQQWKIVHSNLLENIRLRDMVKDELTRVCAKLLPQDDNYWSVEELKRLMESDELDNHQFWKLNIN